jgi:Fe-S-cluster containining protein
VLATPVEVLRIARHIAATRGDEEVARLRAELSALALRTREMTAEEWKRARIPCPLLDGASSSCTIYEVRPAACRAHNSVNVAACIKQFETGDSQVQVQCNDVQQRSILAVSLGFSAACRVHDLEWEGVGLTAGLAAALSSPEAVGEWLAGGRPLESAQTTMSRNAARYRTVDIDRTVQGLQAYRSELPKDGRLSAQNPEEARKERNRRKRERKSPKKGRG